MKLIAPIAVIVVGLASVSHAADLAVLRNGNSIRHEKREVLGAVTRLYLTSGSSGYIEIPTDQIARFEKAPPLPATQTPVAKTGTVVSPQKQETLTREALSQVVNNASASNRLDPDFVNSVIRAESGFHQNAVSRKGAQGLMQLMPGTASQLGVANPFDPAANVQGGTKYLRDLLEKYNFDVNKALAAYNAGPNRVDQYNGIPPYLETRAYISRIIRDYNRKKLAEHPELARKTRTHTTRTARHSTPPKTKTASRSKVANTGFVAQQTGSQ